jgi:hypothetical protein
MTTPELASPDVPQPELDAQTTEPIEAVRLPDGSVQPAYELALMGLEASLKAGEIDEQRVAQMYKAWDPKLPEANIFRHINNR